MPALHLLDRCRMCGLLDVRQGVLRDVAVAAERRRAALQTGAANLPGPALLERRGGDFEPVRFLCAWPPATTAARPCAMLAAPRPPRSALPLAASSSIAGIRTTDPMASCTSSSPPPGATARRSSSSWSASASTWTSSSPWTASCVNIRTRSTRQRRPVEAWGWPAPRGTRLGRAQTPGTGMRTAQRICTW